MPVARRVIAANVRASRGLSAALALPTDKTLWARFEGEVQESIRALPDGATVVDVGGGRRCVYHHALRPGIELIATDVSADELALNPHASRTLVADISRELPLPPSSADLVVSRAVLEHVPDVEAAARHMHAALKPGATTLHLVPARNSLFALAARLLPFERLLSALHFVDPGTVDQVEFDVHYDHGTPAGLRSAFQKAGFATVEVEMTWASPRYFEFALPLFTAYAVYEVIIRKLRIEALASYVLVRATRAV